MATSDSHPVRAHFASAKRWASSEEKEKVTTQPIAVHRFDPEAIARHTAQLPKPVKIITTLRPITGTVARTHTKNVPSVARRMSQKHPTLTRVMAATPAVCTMSAKKARVERFLTGVVQQTALRQAHTTASIERKAHDALVRVRHASTVTTIVTPRERSVRSSP